MKNYVGQSQEFYRKKNDGRDQSNDKGNVLVPIILILNIMHLSNILISINGIIVLRYI